MKKKLQLIASIKIWIVIYPSLTMFLYLFGESLSGLPIYIRTLLMTISLVPLVVFAGIPFLDSVIRFFTKIKYNRINL